MSERILLAVDASRASARAIEYVAAMVAGIDSPYLHLVHVLPPAAAGADAESEQAAARELLDSMKQQLVTAGLDPEHVDAGVLSLPSMTDFAEGLLDVARDQKCSTVVVGRTSLPWFREAFHHHPADELVKKAHGFTLWIVE